MHCTHVAIMHMLWCHMAHPYSPASATPHLAVGHKGKVDDVGGDPQPAGSQVGGWVSEGLAWKCNSTVGVQHGAAAAGLGGDDTCWYLQTSPNQASRGPQTARRIASLLTPTHFQPATMVSAYLLRISDTYSLRGRGANAQLTEQSNMGCVQAQERCMGQAAAAWAQPPLCSCS